MPMWTENELVDAADKLNIKPPGKTPGTSRKNAVLQRFEVVGGSAREVLSSTRPLDELVKHIRRNAKGCLPATLLSLIALPSTGLLLIKYASAGEKFVTALLHLTVATSGQEAYRESSLRYRFASVFAEDLVMDELQARSAQELRDVVLKAVEGSLAGKVAERLLHKKVADGGLFALRDLQTQESWKVNFPKLTTTTFDELAIVDKKRRDRYYIPLRGNEAAVDAIWPPRVVFQMTISDSHGINYNGVIAKMEHLVGWGKGTAWI